MSDHRFEIKLEFSIYGEDFEWEASLNWNAHDGGCDSRITEFFAGCYEIARAKYDAETAAEDERRALVLIEMKERAELARLLAKYGMTAGDVNASPGDIQAFAVDDFERTNEGLGPEWTQSYGGGGTLGIQGEPARWKDTPPAVDTGL